MKRNLLIFIFFCGVMNLFWGGCTREEPSKAVTTPGGVPVQGMVTVLDLGADYCVPCKMMKPILAKLEAKYRGKAAIVFIDVSEDKEQATRFGVRAIPTQIFFDKDGNEVFRHTGFLGEADIVQKLREMGAG